MTIFEKISLTLSVVTLLAVGSMAVNGKSHRRAVSQDRVTQAPRRVAHMRQGNTSDQTRGRWEGTQKRSKDKK